MINTYSDYIFTYLQDCDYRYELYNLISSVELEFSLTFKTAKKIVINELKQLGEL